MWQAFKWISDVTPFHTREQCGPWDQFHLWLYVWSSVGIAVEYLIISIALVVLARLTDSDRVKMLRQQRPVILPLARVVALFLVMGGIGRALDCGGSFLWPAYRLFAWWHALTFLVGGLCGVHLAKLTSANLTLK